MKALILVGLMLASQSVLANKLNCRLDIYRIDNLGWLSDGGRKFVDIELNKKTKFTVDDLEFTLDAQESNVLGGYDLKIQDSDDVGVAIKTFATSSNSQQKQLIPIAYDNFVFNSIEARAAQVGVVFDSRLVGSSRFNYVENNFESIRQTLKKAFDLQAPLKTGDIVYMNIDGCSFVK